MSRKVRKLKPTRLNVRAKTKIVPRSGRVWPRLWHLDWLQHVERSPFYVQDGKLFRKTTGRPVSEETRQCRGRWTRSFPPPPLWKSCAQWVSKCRSALCVSSRGGKLGNWPYRAGGFGLKMLDFSQSNQQDETCTRKACFSPLAGERLRPLGHLSGGWLSKDFPVFGKDQSCSPERSEAERRGNALGDAGENRGKRLPVHSHVHRIRRLWISPSANVHGG